MVVVDGASYVAVVVVDVVVAEDVAVVVVDVAVVVVDVVVVDDVAVVVGPGARELFRTVVACCGRRRRSRGGRRQLRSSELYCDGEDVRGLR